MPKSKFEEEIDDLLDYVNDYYVNSDSLEDIIIFKINENNRLQTEIFVT